MNKTLLSGLIGLLMPLGGYASMTSRPYTAAQTPQWSPASLLDLQAKDATRNASTDGSPQLVQGQKIRELVIIDAAVPDKTTLYRSLKPGVDVVELNSQQDGLLQLQQVLKNYSGLQAVHLVSHAEQGKILLGNSSIDSTLLAEHPGLLRQLNQSVVDGGDLLLYGCDLAAGTAGQELLELFSSATHLDVAASSDKTGAAELGGDWDLEIQQGDIHSTLAFSPKALADFSGVLAPQTYGFEIFPAGAHPLLTSYDDDVALSGSATSVRGESDRFYLDPISSVETAGFLQVAAVNPVVSFELTGLRIGPVRGPNERTPLIADLACTSAEVRGYTASSGQIVENITIPDSDDIITVSLAAFSGQQLRHFKVSASGCTSVGNSLRIADFTVDNQVEGTAPTVSLSVDPSSIDEAAGTATVTATLSAAETIDTSVTLAANGGTATGNDTDYSLSSDSIVIAAGQTTGTATITAVQDSLDEDNETVIIDITDVTGGDGATENAAQQVTVAITDDDAEPSLSIAEVIQSEGNSGSSTMTFTASLSAVSGKTVTVSYGTNDGNAEATTDYEPASGTLTFAPGETSKTIAVTIYGDTVIESNEDFTVSLSSPTKASIADSSATGTIQNDEDVTVPAVTSITRQSPASGVTNATSVNWQVSFSETVNFVNSSDFTLTRTGTADGNISNVAADSGSVYTVTVSSVAGDGILRLDLNSSGTDITDSAGNAIAAGYTSGQVYTLDHTAPAVASVSVPASASYSAGAQLNFTLNFSEAVTLDSTGGTPRIALTIGGSTTYASYVSGSGSSALTFSYTVQSGDLDADGIALAAAIDINGGTIKDGAGNNAVTTLNSIGSTSGILVDAVAPAAPSTPDMTSDTDTGSSNTDDITGDETPTFTGTAEAGSTVKLYDTNGTTELGSGLASGGNWSISSSALSGGSHSITAKATDPAGNVSSASSALDITIDTSLVPLEVTTNSDSGDDLTIAGTLTEDTEDGTGLSLREALYHVANNGIITFFHCLDGQTINLGSAAAVKSGVTLDTSAVGNLTFSGSQLDLLGGMTLSNDATQRLFINSALTGSGTLVKAGAGELTLGSTDNSTGFSGNVTVSAGRLHVGSDSALSSGTLTLDGGILTNNGVGFNLDNPIVLGASGGGVFVSSAAQTLTLSGTISGSGALNKTSGGNLTLTGTNSFSGGLSVSGVNGLTVTDESNLGTGVVTLNESTLLTVTGTSITLNNSINFAGSATLSNSNEVTLAGVLSGSGSMTKGGSGVLSLSGTNTATGSVVVSAGGLSLIGGSSIGNTADVTVDAGATLTLAGGGETIGALTGSGNVVLNSYNLTTGGNNSSSTFSGVIAGTGSGITKAGTGIFTLTGNNTYTGSTTVSAGTLSLNRAGGAIADTSNITVSSGATLLMMQDETLGALAGAGNVNLGTFTLTVGGSNTSPTFSGELSGSGNLIKTGTGTLTLSGSNSYTGTTAITAGVLSVAGDSNLGSSAISITDSELAITAASTIDNAVVLTNAATVSNSSAVTLDGVISGTGELTKSGAGTLRLSAPNSYTGATAVAAGTLLVNGDITASSSVNAASGATLGGTGSVPGATIATGAFLSPGSSGAGSLTMTDGLTIAAGGSLLVDIAGATAGTQYDQLVVTGAVDISGASLSVNHSYTGVDGDSYTVILNDSTDAITGAFSGAAEGSVITATGNSSSLSVSYLGGTGNDTSLTYVAVPGAPTAVSAAAANASASVSFTAPTVTGSTAITSYTVTSTPGNLTASGTGSPILISGLTNGTSYTFTVRATNSAGAGAASTASNAVTPVAPVTNNAPVISGSPATTVVQGTAYSFVPSASDADAQTLTFSISNQPSWASFSTTTGALTGTPAAADVGTTSGIVISVSDGTASASLASFSITVQAANQTPVISGSPSTSVDAGELYSFTPTASDADEGATLTFSISNKPAWASFSATSGELSGTPASANVGATSGIVISVSDGTASASLEAFTLTVVAGNVAPVAADRSATMEEDTPLSLTLTAQDADQDELSYEIVAQPEHGTVTLQGALMVYTPEQNFNGTDSIGFIARDAELSSNTATISLTVTAVNDHPVVADDNFSLQRTENNQYQLAVLANDSDVDGDTLTIDGASTSVGTVAFNTEGLTLTVPDLYAGPVSLRYTVTDGEGGRATANVSLIIEGGDAANLPVITVPADIEVNATALFTRVPLGTATAVDRNGRRLRVSLINGSLFFAPGEHIVYWQATDADGNTATKAQKVSVNPLISLSKDQLVTEGSEVVVDVILNGPAPVYPVSVPYSVSGSAGANDHTLVSGVAEISSGTSTSIRFTVLDDAVADSPEDIVITLDSSVNRGSKRSSRILVSEANIAPVVALEVEQNGLSRLTISEGDGVVTVTATVTDANPQDQVTGSWNVGRLDNVTSDQTQLSFDPAEQGPGLYLVSYTATDNGTPNLSATSRVFIVIRPNLPTLGTGDTDSDLIPDDQEGFADSDGDGIPDYQDAINECNVMPTELLGQTDFVAEGEPGVCLRLGTVAAETDAGGLQIEKNAVETDNVAVNIGGIFDFIAYGLPEQGQSYSLVIPQRLPVPANAVYRKFNDVTGWVDFVSNANNSVSSSQGERGFCPPPGDAVWTSGLTEGHWCVQVRVQDGGPNDADGIANGAIVDPGGVAVALNGNNLPVAVADAASTKENTSVTVNVLANDTDVDGDSLLVNQAVSGFGTVTILADQQLSYTPNPDFAGVDTVIYSITDGKGGTASAELVVDVFSNSAPVAVNDVASTNDRTAVLIAVLANDTDEDSNTLTVSAASAVQGSVSIEADQRLRYTPKAGFEGVDTISYTVTDGLDGEATAVVSVTVTAYKDVVVENKSGGGSMTLWMMVALAGAVALRRRSVVGLAAVALLSFSPLSQAADWGLSLYAGQSKAESRTAPSGSTVLAQDDTDSLKGLSLSYQLHPKIAVELGYLDLGQGSLQLQAQSLTPAEYHQAVKDLTPLLGEGWTAGVRLSLWQDQGWAVQAPMGLYRWQVDISSQMGNSRLNSSLEGTDWYAGLELSKELTTEWQLGLGYQQLRLDNTTVDAVMLRLSYGF